MSQDHIRRAAGWPWWKRAWAKVHEPRVIAVTQAVVYLLLGGVGAYARINPPSTIEGAIGATAMTLLAGLLVFGGLIIGWWTALLGIHWLERFAVVSVACSAGIYAYIIFSLHLLESGNRLLQLGFVLAVLLYQPIRWMRLRESPYDRSLHI